MQFHIRKWNHDDANDIALLNQQWGYPSTIEEIDQRLQELASLPDNALFIAETSVKVAGWLHVYKHFSMGSEAFAEIGGLVVDAAYRQHGIGKALVEKARDWTDKNGSKKLLVRTNIKREEANAFYQKCGLRQVKQQNIFEVEL